MDPRNNSNSGLGLPQPGSDMGQLPPIHAPQTFHAPDTEATHFDAAAPAAVAPPLPSIPAAPAAITPPAAIPMSSPQQVAAPTNATSQGASGLDIPADDNSQLSVVPAEDTDTDFDEEWIGKAREVISRTVDDPYLQSKELGKLKAQYIKLRYNKDIKVDEE